MKNRVMVSVVAALFLALLLVNVTEAANIPFGNGENPVKKIAKEFSPAVVNIDVEAKVARATGGGFEEELFKRFFGDEFKRYSRSVPMKGRGSGFIVSKDGKIFTNNHVIDGAEKITVTLSNGKTYEAKVLGKDSTFDLAIIKIEAKEDLPIIEMGDSDATEVGDWVVAIGNPFGFEHSVTVGVISAKNRSVHVQNVNFDGFMQTDAAINPGNSGGPLIGFDGKVVGINTAILASGQGLGFAVPVNMAKQIMNDLVEFGSVKRGYLGVSIQNIGEELAEAFGINVEEGVVVGDIVAGEAAEKAGVERGDIITRVNGEKIKNSQAFVNKIRSFAPGSKVKFDILRNNKKMDIEITLGVMPNSGGIRAGSSDVLNNLGIQAEKITNELQKQYKLESRRGLVITNVEAGSIAEAAGLAPGDVIFAANNMRVNSIEDIGKAASDKKSIALLIGRDGRTFLTPMKMK